MSEILLQCSVVSTTTLTILFVVALVTGGDNKMIAALGHITGVTIGLWTAACIFAVIN